MKEDDEEVDRSTISAFIKRFREQPPAPVSQRKALGGKEFFWWLPQDKAASEDDEGLEWRTEQANDVEYFPSVPSIREPGPRSGTSRSDSIVHNLADLSLSRIRVSQSSQAVTDQMSHNILDNSYDFDSQYIYSDDVTRLADQLVQKCENLLNQHSPKGVLESEDSKQTFSLSSSLQSSSPQTVHSSVQSSMQSDSPSQSLIDLPNYDTSMDSCLMDMERTRTKDRNHTTDKTGIKITRANLRNKGRRAHVPCDLDSGSAKLGGVVDSNAEVVDSNAEDSDNSSTGSTGSGYMFISPSTSCTSSVHHLGGIEPHVHSDHCLTNQAHVSVSVGASPGQRITERPVDSNTVATSTTCAVSASDSGLLSAATGGAGDDSRLEVAAATATVGGRDSGSDIGSGGVYNRVVRELGGAIAGTAEECAPGLANSSSSCGADRGIGSASGGRGGGGVVTEATVRDHLGDEVLARLWARLMDVRAALGRVELEGVG